MTKGDHDWLGLLRQTADAVAGALEGFDRWRDRGERAGQYALDLMADAAAAAVLDRAGVGVLSEESGLRRGNGSEIVIVDPVDGSTNASRRIPHYCVSLCVVDGDVPLAGLVRHLVSGEEFTATAGGGACLDGQPIRPDCNASPERAIIAVSGRPVPGWLEPASPPAKNPSAASPPAARPAAASPAANTATEDPQAGRPTSDEPAACAPAAGTAAATERPQQPPNWQIRALGASALDLCAVACARLDGFVDLDSAHGVWDYAAAILICDEAGACTAEASGQPLFHLDHARRLGPIAAGNRELTAALVRWAKSETHH